MGCPHFTFYRGKRIIVVMKDKEIIKTKFLENKNKFIVTEYGKINKCDVKMISIMKERR